MATHLHRQFSNPAAANNQSTSSTYLFHCMTKHLICKRGMFACIYPPPCRYEAGTAPLVGKPIPCHASSMRIACCATPGHGTCEGRPSPHHPRGVFMFMSTLTQPGIATDSLLAIHSPPRNARSNPSVSAPAQNLLSFSSAETLAMIVGWFPWTSSI